MIPAAPRTAPAPLTPTRPMTPRPRQQGSQAARWASGLAVVALAAGASWFATRLFDQSLARLDQQALRQAGLALDRTIEQQRSHALSEVRLLSDDNRVRATVITPRFDEATVRDVLDDLRRASGAAVLAVLDVTGKVGAVSGNDAIKKESFGQAAAVKAALERPTADVWSFPDRVLTVAVAPILSGNQVAALLMIGFEVGQPALGAIEQTLGVSGGLVVADRVVARSSSDAAVAAALETARGTAEGSTRLVSGARAFMVRASKTSEAATAARAVWLVPQHHLADQFGAIPQALWTPVLAAVAMLLLSIVWTRR
jgi:hypothetical protein